MPHKVREEELAKMCPFYAIDGLDGDHREGECPSQAKAEAPQPPHNADIEDSDDEDSDGDHKPQLFDPAVEKAVMYTLGILVTYCTAPAAMTNLFYFILINHYSYSDYSSL